MVPKVKRGDIVDVKITGIQPYGAFASLPDNSTGLIHISEISDKFVKSIDSFVKVGEFIKVKVIDFDEETNHAKLSLKAIDNIAGEINVSTIKILDAQSLKRLMVLHH